MVKLQPSFSERRAMLYVDMALPIYTQAFIIPETVETLPYFLKNGGIIQISKRLTPCILPDSTAERITEREALFPLKNDSKRAEIAPIEKITPAQKTGLVNFFLYKAEVTLKHKMLKRGRTTPVKIEITLLML